MARLQKIVPAGKSDNHASLADVAELHSDTSIVEEDGVEIDVWPSVLDIYKHTENGQSTILSRLLMCVYPPTYEVAYTTG